MQLDPGDPLDLREEQSRGAAEQACAVRGSYDDVVRLKRSYTAGRMAVRGPVFLTRS